MDNHEGQASRVFIGNVAPDTDPDLIEQHFKVSYTRFENLRVCVNFEQMFILNSSVSQFKMTLFSVERR